MKTLYLHVGAGKTGTSAIQNSIYINRSNLLEKGIMLPFIDAFVPIQGKDYMGNGEILVSALVHSVEVERTFSQFFNSIKGLGKQKESGSILVSCEMLEWANKENLSYFFTVCKTHSIEVNIIYFVRDVIEYALSFWLQKVKNHEYSFPWSHFANEFTLPFKDTISKYEEVFGQGSVLCEKYRKSGNVISDFYSLIGVDDSNFIPINNVINESLAAKTVELALFVNKFNTFSPQDKRELIRAINQYFIKSNNYGKPPAKLPEEIFLEFRKRNFSNIPFVNQRLKTDSITW